MGLFLRNATYRSVFFNAPIDGNDRNFPLGQAAHHAQAIQVHSNNDCRGAGRGHVFIPVEIEPKLKTLCALVTEVLPRNRKNL